MELTDKIRRVYLPMTETGFYILFCLQKEGHGYSNYAKGQGMTDSQVLISPGLCMGPCQKWKGWFDFLCPRRGKTENLSDNRLGTKSLRY